MFQERSRKNFYYAIIINKRSYAFFNFLLAFVYLFVHADAKLNYSDPLTKKYFACVREHIWHTFFNFNCIQFVSTTALLFPFSCSVAGLMLDDVL